eukprot:c7856_g1_i1.p1 GENE.c7856_g1_i1~~c7856_g1_i1.p1  ORF type:complete len:611 (-),score=177.85 c7856_g1_i1:141-1973(-)
MGKRKVVFVLLFVGLAFATQLALAHSLTPFDQDSLVVPPIEEYVFDPSVVVDADVDLATTQHTSNLIGLSQGGDEEDEKAKSRAPAGTRYAFVTLVFSDDDYVKGCTVLGRSLALTGSTLPRVLLSLTDLSAASTKALEQIGGWEIRRVEHIATPFPDKCWRFCDMYGKLRVWESLVDYDLAMYLDSDMFVTKNVDYLFPAYRSLGENEIATVADSGAPHMNGGMFMYRPSRKIFNDMLSKMGKIEYAVIRHPYSLSFAYEYTEQSFIHAYFRPCLFTENCVSNRLRVISNKYNCQLHTPKCRAQFEDSANDVAVFHYTSLPKPWTCGDGGANSCCDAVKGAWSTNVYKRQDMCSSKAYSRAYEVWSVTWKNRANGLQNGLLLLDKPSVVAVPDPKIVATKDAVFVTKEQPSQIGNAATTAEKTPATKQAEASIKVATETANKIVESATAKASSEAAKVLTQAEKTLSTNIDAVTSTVVNANPPAPASAAPASAPAPAPQPAPAEMGVAPTKLVTPPADAAIKAGIAIKKVAEALAAAEAVLKKQDELTKIKVQQELQTKAKDVVDVMNKPVSQPTSTASVTAPSAAETDAAHVLMNKVNPSTVVASNKP